ncbi:MAG TPA: DUF4214 domain-containing protein [Pirellulales bacterium]|nr:DUF4214 domain-containing protein [Pirellulales bacterium]
MALFKNFMARVRRESRPHRKVGHGPARRKTRLPFGGLEQLEHRTYLAADLAVTNVASTAAAVVPGDVVEYHITIQNNGNSNATNTIVTDQLPTGETFMGLEVPNAASSPDISYDQSTNTVTYNAGTVVGIGSTAQANVFALVNSSASGTLTNTANAYSADDPTHSSAGTAASSQQQNSASSLGAGATDLAISVYAANDNMPVNPGGIDTETYNIVVKNDGPNTATGVVVTDYLPASFPGTNTSEPSGVNLTFPETDVAQATLPDLNAGASETFTITFDGPDTPPGALINTAFVTDANGDSDPTDNSATTVTPVNPSAGSAVDLSVTQSAASLSPPNQPLVYTVTVTNNSGSTDATNVYVNDLLPMTTTFVGGSTSVGGVDLVAQSGSVVSALFPTLAHGTSATLTITVTPSASGTLANSAYVESADDVDSSQTDNGSTLYTSAGLVSNFEAGTPGDGTSQTFIGNLYYELLGRAGDAGGVTYWLNFLQSAGSAGRAEVVADFLNSTEYKTVLVRDAYQTLLGRAPDAAGMQYWLQELGYPSSADGQAGTVDEKLLVITIASSNEYYSKAGNTNQGWVDWLYLDLLGRHADPSGEAYWTQQADNLTPATRGTLVLSLLNSAEVEEKLLNTDYPNAGSSSSPGTIMGGSYALANITGGGWENLYLQGPYIVTGGATDPFLTQLQAQVNWDDVIAGILESSQYYTNSN